MGSLVLWTWAPIVTSVYNIPNMLSRDMFGTVGVGYQSLHQFPLSSTCSRICLVPWAWGTNRHVSLWCPQHAPGHGWYRGCGLSIVTSVSTGLTMLKDMFGTKGVGYLSLHQSLLPQHSPGHIRYRGHELSIVTSVSTALNMLQNMFGTVGVRYQSSHRSPLSSTCFRIFLVPGAWGINRPISFHCPQHAPGYVWYVSVRYQSSHQSPLSSTCSRTCLVPWVWGINRHISLYWPHYARGHFRYQGRGVPIVTSVSTALYMLQDMFGTVGVGYQSSHQSPLPSTCPRTWLVPRYQSCPWSILRAWGISRQVTLHWPQHVPGTCLQS